MSKPSFFPSSRWGAIAVAAQVGFLLSAIGSARADAERPPVAASPDTTPGAGAPTFEMVVTPSAAPDQTAPLPANPAPVRLVGPVLVAPDRAPPCPSSEPSRSGFYLRLLEGPGYARFHGTGPKGSVTASGLGSHSTVAIGGGLARGLSLAGTVQSTTTDSELKGGPFSKATVTTDSSSAVASSNAKLTHSQVGVLVDWYPAPLQGFHGGVSAGLGAISLVNDADNSKLAGTAASGSVFVGYDAAISHSWSLGIALVASGVTTASMKSSSGDESGYKLNGFSFQLAASILDF